jgi:putative transcription antitermination factor YqgF
MFTTIGIDWGGVRFGLAFGSLETDLIIPATFECFSRDIFSILDKEILARKIQTIVVGLPTNFHGRNTNVTDKINGFIKELNLLYPTLIIVTINERSSTKDAKKDLENDKNKHSINHQAAAKILEYYFYKLSHENNKC